LEAIVIVIPSSYVISTGIDKVEGDGKILAVKRLVALVELDGKMKNEEMVAEGWAWAYRDYLNREYASEFIDLEERARKQHHCLWKQSNHEPPWEFRKLQKQNRKK
jgi:endonuclease YncB( thermonuclease family)